MASKRIDRVAQRPDPADWDLDEIMNLGEAARLLWPDGWAGERFLRSAVREGRLPISRVAGKYFVTRRALSALSKCDSVRVSHASSDTDKGGYLADLAAIDRMGRK